MKQLITRLPKKMLAGVAFVAAIIGIVTATTAWSPDRPTYTYQSPAPYVTFNSITNNPNYGDERTFFDAKSAANTSTGGFVNNANTEGADEMLLRVYVHNNAADNLNTVPDGNGGFKGIAKNTKVRIQLPTAAAANLRANAYISADNAQPQIVSDEVDFSGSGAFSLEYVPGSARAYNNAVPGGMTLSDSIVTTGAPIGYEAANGTLPGCFQYANIVTIKVKVKKPAYSVQKSVRLEGQTSADWKESVKQEAGKNVDWRIEFKNNGSTQLKDVKVVDEVPAGLAIVPGSVKLYNTSNPSGYTYPDSAIQASGRQINVNIGTYNPAAGAFVTFKTKVPEAKDLKCGVNKYLNLAYATPEGSGTVSDGADVTVEKKCENTPTYVCETLKIEKTTGREVKVSEFKTSQANGATFKNVVINWGDNTTPLTTNNAVGQKHTYAADGTYTVIATATFTVNGADKTTTSEACKATVSFGTTPTTPTTPGKLPNTGAGDVVGIFTAVTVAGAVAHRYFLGRQYS